MNLELDENKAVNLIKAYAPGRIIIANTTYTDSLILTPTLIQPHFQPNHIQALRAEHLAFALTSKPKIVILGTGESMVYLKPDIYGELMHAGIGFEYMSTPAACRTYNALAAENRDVLAILMLA